MHRSGADEGDDTPGRPPCEQTPPHHAHSRSGHGQHHTGHPHAGHDHGVRADADVRHLALAAVVLAVFLAVELIAAIITGSVALLSDAGHMLSDLGALAMAWAVSRIARRPAAGARTWGWRRAEILSAAVNGITLLVVAVVVGSEAIRRLIEPPAVEGVPVVAVAATGVVVNLVVAWLVARANRSSLNVEGAYQHIITDLYGFVGTIVAGIVIMATGWTRADPLASLAVCALMIHAAQRLLRGAGRILLEMAPVHIDIASVRAHLLELDHVHDVHDLHLWSVSSDLPALSAHLVVDDSCFHDGHTPRLLDSVQGCLASHFDVAHSTFQFEPLSHQHHEPSVH